MAKAEHQEFLLAGDGAGDEHLPDIARIPFWRRAVEWARDINTEASHNQKVGTIVLAVGSAAVGAAASRQIISHHR